MAKRKEEQPPAGAPAWMATFSDLMNLLLCFFVMLFAMSTVEESKLQEFVAAMNNTFSIFDGGANAIGDGILVSNGVSQLNELDQYINSTGKTADSSTDGDNLEEFELNPEAQETLEEFLEEEKLKQNEVISEGIEEALNESKIGDEVELSFTAQYVQLTMNGALLYDSGSADLKADAEQVLDKVGIILERYGTGIIEIVGHTDNVPQSGSLYADNEELSSARALSVFYYLSENTFLDPVNLRHAGMGERVPVADNSTPEGRSRNRRVEIRIYNPSQG
ncbi:photosystem I P700 chlorophyll a apoprotein A2 [Lachnospiraceae bacterium]|jgi:chemotaxis protein MotB|nr:flagellar motor protein MotB [Lachnospiraceae bacterium]MCX4304195.1 flagellar motor protein MotB [Acetatifactor sp.]GFI64699.1 photosystem I P700 chlorophyll a apoprotein A2 [Lachnospiraceae bacterium]